MRGREVRILLSSVVFLFSFQCSSFPLANNRTFGSGSPSVSSPSSLPQGHADGRKVEGWRGFGGGAYANVFLSGPWRRVVSITVAPFSPSPFLSSNNIPPCLRLHLSIWRGVRIFLSTVESADGIHLPPSSGFSGCTVVLPAASRSPSNLAVKRSAGALVPVLLQHLWRCCAPSDESVPLLHTDVSCLSSSPLGLEVGGGVCRRPSSVPERTNSSWCHLLGGLAIPGGVTGHVVCMCPWLVLHFRSFGHFLLALGDNLKWGIKHQISKPGCCTCVLVQVGDPAVHAFFLPFGLMRGGRVRASLLSLLRFNGEDVPRLSSVKQHKDLRLSLSQPQVHTPTRLSGEPLTLRLVSTQEALEGYNCRVFVSGFSPDLLSGSNCNFQHVQLACSATCRPCAQLGASVFNSVFQSPVILTVILDVMYMSYQ